MYVTSGDMITFSIAGHTANYLPMTSGDLRNAVASYLTSFFDVLDFSVNGPSLLGAAVTFQWIDYTYSGSITVQVRSDYASEGDVASVIAHGFEINSGGLPTVSTLAQQSPATNPQVIPGDFEMAPWWQGISNALSSVFNGLSGDVVIVLVLVLAALYVLANGKSLKLGANL